MKYKVGDVVRIKQLEDLKKEYVVVGSGRICTPGIPFSQSMRKYCGEVVEIAKVNNKSYKILEDNGTHYWTDYMFEEPVVYNISITADNENYDKICVPSEYLSNSTNVIGNSLDNARKMIEECKKKLEEKEMRINNESKKDKDYYDRVEKLKEKINFYRRKSGFIAIDEVVPGKVVNVRLSTSGNTDYFECKMVCDDMDKFSIERALYLAMAKYEGGKVYTSEGIEWLADQMMMNRKIVNKVEAALKMLEYEKKLKNEEKQHEAAIEARRAKRWERKQRQMDRRAEKQKALEQKEKERQIEIQKEAYIRAMEDIASREE